MKIIENRNINKIYCIMIEHPSRAHVVIPSRIENGIICSIKDNAVSKLNAILFLDETNAINFSKSINTTCPIKVVSLGNKLFSEVEKVGLIAMDNLINNYVNCYLINTTTD